VNADDIDCAAHRWRVAAAQIDREIEKRREAACEKNGTLTRVRVYAP